VVFTANHLTDTDKQKVQENTQTPKSKQCKIQQTELPQFSQIPTMKQVTHLTLSWPDSAAIFVSVW